jgi:hypothetical protein
MARITAVAGRSLSVSVVVHSGLIHADLSFAGHLNYIPVDLTRKGCRRDRTNHR